MPGGRPASERFQDRGSSGITCWDLAGPLSGNCDTAGLWDIRSDPCTFCKLPDCWVFRATCLDVDCMIRIEAIPENLLKSQVSLSCSQTEAAGGKNTRKLEPWPSMLSTER